MKFTATATHRRISTTRVRLVGRLIRGKNVVDALAILANTPKAGAAVLEEVVSSARANAIEMDRQKNLKINPDRLHIAELKIDGGPMMRRFRPMSMGRAGRIRKRTTHITVVLSDDAPKAPKKAGRRG